MSFLCLFGHFLVFRNRQLNSPRFLGTSFGAAEFEVLRASSVTAIQAGHNFLVDSLFRLDVLVDEILKALVKLRRQRVGESLPMLLLFERVETLFFFVFVRDVLKQV